MQGLSGYELNIGDQVEVLDNYRDRTDGFLIGTVTRFVDKDGNPGDALVLITPNHTVLRDEHPHGVRVGSAHWGTLVRRLDDQPGTIEETERSWAYTPVSTAGDPKPTRPGWGCPQCDFTGTQAEVDEHRATGIHNDEPQAGGNLAGRRRS